MRWGGLVVGGERGRLGVGGEEGERQRDRAGCKGTNFSGEEAELA